MKRINIYLLSVMSVFGALMLQSCDDFFQTDPNNIINTDDYISKDDEMYKGFLGIYTRMQDAGDHSIFLTDTRANVLEITGNAPVPLQNIYNYESTDGNEYADPTCYYAIVIACNDYIHKMDEYHKRIQNSMSEKSETNFIALLSSTIRIKVWAYYMLGRIYGEAYWFDDALTELVELDNTEIFTKCTMQELTEKCIALLENGIVVDGVQIDSDIVMNWVAWLDEEMEDEAQYGYWQYLTPPYVLLRAELGSWRCNYLGEEAAKAEWLLIRDMLLQYMYGVHTGTIKVPGVNDAPDTENDEEDERDGVYQIGIQLQSDMSRVYYKIFASEQVGQKFQLVSGIMYDYDNHQRNRLVQYFCPTWPGRGEGYFLKPSEYGKSLYAETDIRGLTQKMVMNTLGGEEALTKYYYYYDGDARNFQYLRTNIFEIQPTIVTFRGHDFHFLLAEAENHLGNWRQARALLNGGLTEEFAERPSYAAGETMPEGWAPEYITWFGEAGGYGNNGIAGSARGTHHDLKSPEEYANEAERIKAYDLAIADEHLLEYVAEGKSYSYLCKMAERYDKDPDIVADRVAPKYAASGKDGKVRAAIQNGYFIQWNLEK